MTEGLMRDANGDPVNAPVLHSASRPQAMRALYGLFTGARGVRQDPIDLTPDTVDITFPKGADVTIFLDVADTEDLSDWAITGEIRVLDELVGSWTVVDQEGGTITLQLPHSVTALLPAVCAYDIWRCDFPRGPLVQGVLTVEPRVTVCPPGG